MEAIRRFLLTKLFPPPLVGGMTFSHWLKVLRKNRFSIDPRFWLRAALVTAGSTVNSLSAWQENLRFADKIRDVSVKKPLIILGHWRSGTTHLHNLLAIDHRLIAPTTYQVFYPHSMLSMESSLGRLVDLITIKVRPMDAMKTGMGEPQEDEFAIATLCGISQAMGMVFDRSMDEYEKYVTFEGVDANEIEAWKLALHTFAKKVLLRGEGRTLVLKSPQHTGRIAYLLDTFPDARFIHIHRHPYDVFRSMTHTWVKLAPWFQLQNFDRDKVEERVIRRYQVMHESLFGQTSLIPSDRFIEVGYDQLVASPMPTLANIYETLDLSPFDEISHEVSTYLESLQSYETNRFSELDPDLKKRLYKEWMVSFEKWNYLP